MEKKSSKINGRNSGEDDEDMRRLQCMQLVKSTSKVSVPAVENGATNRRIVATKMVEISVVEAEMVKKVYWQVFSLP
jgi:hypothetical protein